MVTVIVPVATFGIVALSFTVTGKLNDPAELGVPFIVPSEFSVKPGGGVPIVHVYGAVPPLTMV